MVDFAKSYEWTEGDLSALISEGVEENLNLDYKGCPSLQKRDQERREISKDVSAFANSAGGIIVYGIIEDNHKPTGLDQGYDPGDISKEWLEQVMQGNVRPRIPGVHINPVDLSGPRLGKVVYVVTVPQGKTAHQAADLKYHKRFNFESVAMYDYEIRDIMARFTYPLVVPIFSATLVSRQTQKYKLNIALQNQGATCARDVKLVFFWPRPIVHECGGGYRQRIIVGRITIPSREIENIELTVPPFSRPIFPEDEFRLTDEDSRFHFTFQIDEAALVSLTRRPYPQLVWKVYADDMPPQTGSISIGEMEGLSPPEHVRYRSG